MTHDQARPLQPDLTAPVLGESISSLADWLVKKGTFSTVDDFEPVRRDALAIVRNCLPFRGPAATRTGLVVGYVQSGKTVSMEAVSAIARDSGCRIVVLLAGVTTNLLQQNAARFMKDLRGESSRRAWKIFNSENGFNDNEKRSLQQAVEEWRGGNVDESDQQTLLLLVLKNHIHLERLRVLLSSVDLKNTPALILDDEADQAGLNAAVTKGAESTTYARIARVRACLPHHTYLQYTATPQAPLLIALDDMLSPAFAELVEPGRGYTGGKAFFGRTATPQLVRAIPNDDLFKPGMPPDDPPESMLDALRVFFVGCAVAAHRGAPSLRSMLIHPSPRKNDHRRYLTWVQEATARWSASLASPDAADREDAAEEFLEAYKDLATTDNALPAFEGLVPKLLLAVRRVQLKEVNSEDGTEVDWENAAEHILVGGEKLNRGFTVEGLTVTYMPRDAGDWNADTIQQRARFFGYKQKYLSLCRLYLHPDVIHAFRAYVIHEEDVRSQLAEHRGRPLREWRRAFFMDDKMRPTRRNVLADPYFRVRAKQAWFVQEQLPLDPDAAARNAVLIRGVEDSVTFLSTDGFFEHRSVEADLSKLFREVLLSYETHGSDVASWYAQLVMIRDILETDPEAVVTIVKMSVPRKRTLADDGTIKLHQGRSSSKAEGKYPGDAMIRDASSVTVQIHWIDIDERPELGKVPALAIHIPKDLRKDDVLAKE